MINNRFQIEFEGYSGGDKPHWLENLIVPNGKYPIKKAFRSFGVACVFTVILYILMDALISLVQAGIAVSIQTALEHILADGIGFFSWVNSIIWLIPVVYLVVAVGTVILYCDFAWFMQGPDFWLPNEKRKMSITVTTDAVLVKHYSLEYLNLSFDDRFQWEEIASLQIKEPSIEGYKCLYILSQVHNPSVPMWLRMALRIPYRYWFPEDKEQEIAKALRDYAPAVYAIEKAQ